MKTKNVYLTFHTDKETSEKLKFIAQACKMTQPQLIESICKDFIENVEETAKRELEKEGISESQ